MILEFKEIIHFINQINDFLLDKSIDESLFYDKIVFKNSLKFHDLEGCIFPSDEEVEKEILD